MEEPATFKAFWLWWERRPTLRRFRPDFVYVAATFEAVGANSDAEALTALRKVLAVGVACGEQHGLRGRARAEAVGQRMRSDGFYRIGELGA